MHISKIINFIIAFLICNTAHGMQIIIDEEAEEVITEIARPIFRAAGLPGKDLKIKIVGDKSINAFVMDNTNIFIFTDLITFSDTPDVLAGVIAHECAHIALGHISLTREKMESLKNKMIASTILGAAAGLLSGNFETFGAVALGGKHAAEMDFLKHSRIQESQADAAAIKYLEKIKLSPDGLSKLLRHLNSNERIFYKGSNPYLLTHPVSRERINYIKQNTNLPSGSLPASLNHRYKMVVAKIFAFTSPFKEVFKKYGGTDKPDLYAHSITYYKIGKLKTALELIDKLLLLEPNNPYFIELKAQFLYENGKVNESITYYEKALKLKSTSTIFKIELASALITADSDLKKAGELLRSAIDVDRSNFSAWHSLGIVLGKENMTDYSYIALAHAFSIIGDTKTAKKFINSINSESNHIKDPFYISALEEAKTAIKK